jgi:ankyrin repeat protein
MQTIEEKISIIEFLPPDVAIYIFEYLDFYSLSKLYLYEPDKHIIYYLSLPNNSFVKKYHINTRLFEGVLAANKDIVNMLVKVDHINMNQADRFGITPLFRAVQQSNLDIVNLLLENKNIDVNKATCRLESPLYIAASKGNKEITLRLLKVPEIKLTTWSTQMVCIGNTPLYIAVLNNHKDIVQILLDKDKDKGNKCINMCNRINFETGGTPLWLAANEGQLDIVNLLLNNDNIDVNIKNLENQRTPLIQAGYKDRQKVFQILLKKTDINENELKDLLYKLALKGYKKICNIILDTNKISPNDLHEVMNWLGNEYISEHVYFSARVDTHKEIIKSMITKRGQLKSKEKNIKETFSKLKI